MNSFIWLEEWYKSNCNGDWEEYYGIKIQTIDNPGWHVEIDITETDCEKKSFNTIDIDNSDDDWVKCEVIEGKFSGFGDKSKLSFILGQFKEWVESNQ